MSGGEASRAKPTSSSPSTATMPSVATRPMTFVAIFFIPHAGISAMAHATTMMCLQRFILDPRRENDRRIFNSSQN